MLRKQLSIPEIEHILRTEVIGRLGCHGIDPENPNGGPITYVVPVSYVYDYADKCIYSYSPEGLKLRLIRKYPEVCFEVEHIESPMNWQTVIAWGEAHTNLRSKMPF